VAIKEALDKVHREIAITDRGAATDFEFHSAIVRASHSAVLLLIYDSLETLLRKSHYERRAAILDDPEFLAMLGEAHTALYLAVAAGDEQTAEDEMRRHYRLVQLFEEKSESREKVAAPK
jgi:GntR family transcriptional regulator, transcriptional repressor for pyruvate dehydrogenase complex